VYGSIRITWWKDLQSDMGFIPLFGVNLIKQWRVPLQGRKTLKNGTENGNYPDWIPAGVYPAAGGAGLTRL
jgi:hypothetical protein